MFSSRICSSSLSTSSRYFSHSSAGGEGFGLEVFFALCNLVSWCGFFDQEQIFFLLKLKLKLKLEFSNFDFFDLYKLEPHPLKGDSVSQSILYHLS